METENLSIMLYTLLIWQLVLHGHYTWHMGVVDKGGKYVTYRYITISNTILEHGNIDFKPRMYKKRYPRRLALWQRHFFFNIKGNRKPAQHSNVVFTFSFPIKVAHLFFIVCWEFMKHCVFSVLSLNKMLAFAYYMSLYGS